MQFLSSNSVDFTPPVISGCLEDFIEETPLGSPGKTVIWVEPSATDNSGSAILTSRTHAPGQFFTVGLTTITYVFADPTGNEAVCSFDVTVIEGIYKYKCMNFK